MTPHCHIVRSALVLLLAAAPSAAFADGEAEIEGKADSAEEEASNELHGRFDLSHTMAYDVETSGRLGFSDLRLNAGATRLAGLPVGLHLDGRARRSWDEQTDDRITVRDAFLRIGEEGDSWQVDLGRQVVRAVAAAELDGVRVHRRLGKRASASLFGGLMPHPISSYLDPDFTEVGAGYDYRGRSLTHSGGAVASWYRGQTNRAYITERGYMRVGRDLVLTGFGIVDFVSTAGESGATVDPTSLMATVRYRPRRWLDSALSATHHHTVLPGKWWADWLNQRRREIGFVLDGVDPVGTRISSLRWTNNLRIHHELTPYLRLRRDWRHSDDARGYEGRAGVKWKRGLDYANASYAYRGYFSAKSHLGGVEVGRESTLWGVDAGFFYLRSRPRVEGDTSAAFDVSLMGWLLLGELLEIEQRLHLAVQYQGLFEPDSDLHALFAQFGYRL